MRDAYERLSNINKFLIDVILQNDTTTYQLQGGDMQIKVRGRKIQLLRSEYVQAKRDGNGNLVRGTGRSKQRLIGSFSVRTNEFGQVPEKIKAGLNEGELEELTEWLSDQREKRDKAERARALETLAGQMEMAAGAIEEGSVLSEAEVHKIRSAWGGLQVALRKAGHKRSSKRGSR